MLTQRVLAKANVPEDELDIEEFDEDAIRMHPLLPPLPRNLHFTSASFRKKTPLSSWPSILPSNT